MAFFTLGRRKRRGTDDEHVCDGSDAGELHQPGGALAGYVVDESGALIPADEVHLPRWRRPSLMAARKGTAAVSPDELVASRLTFDHASVRPEPMHERRHVRYRMVRIGDRPDEILSLEIGRLDQGDEVELLESRGAFWKVRVPTGLIGWIHRTTLAEATHSAPSAGAPGLPWDGASGALSGCNYGHNGNGGSATLPSGNHGYGTDTGSNGATQHAGNGHANGVWPYSNGHNGDGGMPNFAGANHGNGTAGTSADGPVPHGNHGLDGSAGSHANGSHADGLSELTGLSDDALAGRLAAAEAMFGDTEEEDVTEGLAARLIRERQRGTPH